jgi:hypothetical protein
MPIYGESDTIHLNKIGQSLAELVRIWHFGDCLSMLEAFLPVFPKSLLLAPVAFGHKHFLFLLPSLFLFSFVSLHLL